MELTKSIIKLHKMKFPDFDEYNLYIELLEENIESKPGVSVGICKSLIEGICKTILTKLKIPYTEKGNRADSVGSLYGKTMNGLIDKTDLEIELIKFLRPVINRIAEIRNNSDFSSHGRIVPYDSHCDKDLALMIIKISDGIIFHLLKIYFSIDLSFYEKEKYENNNEFNEILDQQNDIVGISYSKALYEQDYIAYYEQLENYLDENN